MYSFWSLVLLYVALSDAINPDLDLDLDRRKVLRFMKKGLPHTNTTSMYVGHNSTTSSSSTTWTSSRSTSTTHSMITSELPPSMSTTSRTTSRQSFISHSQPTVSSAVLTNSSSSYTSTSIYNTHQPPISNVIFANSSTSTIQPTCSGSVTYTGTVAPTVFLTVTEGFDVTVTASNVSVTDSATLITPLPACASTVLPLYNPVYGSASESASSAPPQTFTQGGGHPHPNNPNLPQGDPPPSESYASSVVYTSVDYTSTVIITKKTPVTVVVPPTSSANVNFNTPTASPQQPPPNQGGGGGGGGGDASNTSRGGGNVVPAVSSVPAKPTPNVVPAKPTPNVVPNFSPPGFLGGTVIVPAPTPAAPMITASGARIPASPVAPLSTALAGVPVVVLPSNSVVIGSQTVAIPNRRPTTVQASGAVFTIGPSQIIGPSATLSLSQIHHQQIVTPPPKAPITTAIGDLTLTVGPTAAVISGTTYRVGPGAPATTIDVHGTRVSIGAGGVGLPGATIAPDDMTPAPYVVYTTKGLTFSVGSTEAIVDGTTYRVGSNAPELTTTIGPSHVTVSFGPGGVGLASTTLVPGHNPFAVVTAEGLTFSIDGTEAVISGTTYRIGSSASKIITSVASDHSSVSFGPGGIGLKSTTILPTSGSGFATQGAGAGAGSASASASATQPAAVGAGVSSRIATSALFHWIVGVMSLSLACIWI